MTTKTLFTRLFTDYTIGQEQHQSGYLVCVSDLRDISRALLFVEYNFEEECVTKNILKDITIGSIIKYKDAVIIRQGNVL